MAPTVQQQLALQFLQTTNDIATAEQLAMVRMNPQIPRYGQLPIATRVNWMKDQLFVLSYLRHIKDPNPLDILIDAQSTDKSIMESDEYRHLTQVEIQDAFNKGINGEYGDFFGITTSTLSGFLRGYMKAEKWQKAKAIVYSREKERQEEEERRLHRAIYEKRLKEFKMPFWPTTRGKKGVTAQESEEHRKKIAQQREEILKHHEE